MSDGLRSAEVANALLENERAVRAAQSGLHRGFVILDENTREVFRNTDAVSVLATEVGTLAIEVVQIRGTVEALVSLEQGRQDLRKEELRLEREKLDLKRNEDEISGSYEITRLEHDTKRAETRVAAARDAARGLVIFLQTRAGWGVLVLCGMVIAWAMGTERFSDLLSNIVALSKGWRAS